MSAAPTADNPYFDALETRVPEQREQALFHALPGQLERAKATPGFARILKDVDPRAVTDRVALAALPVTRKSALIQMQKDKPPFAGLAAAKPGEFARLFMSPGPIFDPEGRRPDWWRFARALHAAGFRRGDVVLNCFSYHLTPAGSMLESGAHALRCAVIPGGVGNTESQVQAIQGLKPRCFTGTPSFLKIVLDKAAELGADISSLARAIVSAEIAHITYDEFLPHLLGNNAIGAYRGYNPNVNATITEEFAGAAFRFGHSIVSADLQKIDEQGGDLGDELSLKDAFFQSPADFAADGGAAGHLRHLAGDLSNALDVHIVDDLRNFLDVPPVAMDLAAINIQRGRDLGLGTLNETRAALHLKAYTDFSQITSDATTAAALKAAYGSVDRIDLWTGGLAEDHTAGAMIGQTFGLIIAQQFSNLRAGDRLYYENQGFDARTLNEIKSTTLSDLILRNADTENMQSDAFVYYDRHGGTASGGAAENPDAPQLVIGSDGVDTLLGGSKGDILVAAAGQQTMTGGAGADSFVLSTTGTNATITDFRPGSDRIDLSRLDVDSMRDVHIRPDHGNTVIDAGGDHITLIGIDPGRIGARDFIFHE